MLAGLASKLPDPCAVPSNHAVPPPNLRCCNTGRTGVSSQGEGPAGAALFRLPHEQSARRPVVIDMIELGSTLERLLRRQSVDPEATEILRHDALDRRVGEVEVAAGGHQHAAGETIEPARPDLDAEAGGERR